MPVRFRPSAPASDSSFGKYNGAKKVAVTRTFAPLHFEGLDPHRFEDLVRELIYDFREWQAIEATGRSGSDAGFDVRSYERNPATTSNDDDEPSHPMEGNQWTIQCPPGAQC